MSRPTSHEPVQSPAHRTGSPFSGVLAEALDLARAWAGPELEALIVSGSHAGGEAVWADPGTGRVTLSDLDLYAVMPTDAVCRAATARMHASPAVLRASLESRGLAAPLEVGFLTRSGLSHMAARPGTIELRRHGRVAFGDARALEAVPAFTARDVSAEERTLLLENRGFELLLARPMANARVPLAQLLARHATLKTALDLAGVIALEHGEYPDGAAQRVAFAERVRAGDLQIQEWNALWHAALAWRENPVVCDSEAECLAEWQRVVQAWAELWRRRFGAAADGSRGYACAVRDAARAPLKRRVRQALAFRARGGPGPGLASRLAFAMRGTPQHRVNASGTVLLLAAAAGTRETLPVPAARALAALGVVPAAAAQGWEPACDAITRAWDMWLLDGQRTAARA